MVSLANVTHMVNLLMSNGSVVLQDVVVGGARGSHELLESGLRGRETNLVSGDTDNGISWGGCGDGGGLFLLLSYQNLGQLVVGDVGELGAVVLGNDELEPGRCERRREMREGAVKLWMSARCNIQHGPC